MRKLYLILLLIASAAWAQSPYVITGNITDAGGNPAVSGSVTFTLQPPGITYTVIGDALIHPSSTACKVINGGVFSAIAGGCTVWGNDQLFPANSLYQIKIITNGSPQGQIINNVLLNSVNTNLNSPLIITPLPVVGPIITASPLTTLALQPQATHVYSIGAPTVTYADMWVDSWNGIPFSQFNTGGGGGGGVCVAGCILTAPSTNQQNSITPTQSNVQALTLSPPAGAAPILDTLQVLDQSGNQAFGVQANGTVQVGINSQGPDILNVAGGSPAAFLGLDSYCVFYGQTITVGSSNIPQGQVCNLNGMMVWNGSGVNGQNYVPVFLSYQDYFGLQPFADQTVPVYQAGTKSFTMLSIAAASGAVTHTTGPLTLSSLIVGNNGADSKVLASDPTNCAAGNAPTGIDKTGAAKGCAAIGGGGTVTHTGGALTAGQPVVGNGGGDIAVSDTLSPQSGNLSINGTISLSGNNGGFWGGEGNGSNCTIGVGIDCIFPDSTAHNLHVNSNNVDKGTLMTNSTTSTTVTQVAHATSVPGVYLPSNVVTADLPTSQVTRTATVNRISPVVGDSGLLLVIDPSTSVHLTRIWCAIQGSTNVVLNLDKRTEATLGTTGSKLLGAGPTDITAVSGGVTSTTWNNSNCGGTSSCAVAAHAPVVVSITSVSGTPTSLSCSVDYTVD